MASPCSSNYLLQSSLNYWSTAPAAPPALGERLVARFIPGLMPTPIAPPEPLEVESIWVSSFLPGALWGLSWDLIDYSASSSIEARPLFGFSLICSYDAEPLRAFSVTDCFFLRGLVSSSLASSSSSSDMCDPWLLPPRDREREAELPLLLRARPPPPRPLRTIYSSRALSLLTTFMTKSIPALS